MLFSDCGAGPSCDNPTPGGAAFDDALQLWTNRAHSSSVRKRLRAPLGGGASLSRRFQPRTEPAIRPLTPLVAPYSYPFYRAFAEDQNRFCRPRVNEVDFPDPRRLPSTSALLWQSADRAVTPSQHPVYRFRGRPRHRSHRFATVVRLPALFHSSFMLAHCEGARPSAVFTSYSLVNRENRAPLVNFCNRNELRAQPLARPNPAFLQIAKSPFSASPAEVSQVRNRRGKPRLAFIHRDRSR